MISGFEEQLSVNTRFGGSGGNSHEMDNSVS